MTDAQAPERTHAFLFSYLLGADGKGTVLDAPAVTDWSAADGPLWLHLDVTNAAHYEWLRNESGLPRGITDTLLAEETRPRTVVEKDGLLVVMRGVNTNPGEDPEDMVSVRIWLEHDRIITTRRRRLLSVIDIHNLLEEGKGPTSAGALVVMLVDRLATRIGDFVDAIETQLDATEDSIADGNPATTRSRVAKMRRRIAAVKRFLTPQRDALEQLNRVRGDFFKPAEEFALRDEADRITRYLEDLELARERAIVLQEELLNHIAQQQNTRMYVLSVVAAVFLPLTFVTGLLGMNVGGLPGVDSNLGFIASVITMVVAATGLLAFFRWKRWL